MPRCPSALLCRACRAMVHTAHLLFNMVRELGVEWSIIAGLARYEGEPLLNCAVRSRSAAMVEAVVVRGGRMWASREVAMTGE